MQDTKIEWATHTFNPWRGCTKVSPACDNCYAATMSKRNPKILGHWGDDGTRVVAAEKQWREPLKWNAAAKAAGERDRVFCASLADVFEDWPGELRDATGGILHRCHDGHVHSLDAIYARGVECERDCEHPALLMAMDDVRARLFALIDATPNLDWLLLTKRPENIARMMPPFNDDGPCPMSDPSCEGEDGDRHDACERPYRPNVWLGATVENQEQADIRIPNLLKIPAAVRFLSMEPLLGPVHLEPWLSREYEPTEDYEALDGISWIIAGGESGPGARPSHPDWFRSIRDQCTAAGVPFFFKQWGDWLPVGQSADLGDGYTLDNASDGPTLVGKKTAGRWLDGREWSEVPSTQEAAHAR